jgi:hypothetical protein
MQYTPDTIATADLPIAVKHSVGGEKKLYATRDSAIKLGDIVLWGDGSGVWTPDTVGNTILASDPHDLVIVVQNECKANAAPVITFNVVFNDDSTGTIAVTLNPPAWVQNGGWDFQHGAAKDFTPSATGKTVKSITSLASVTNAKKWSGFQVWALPPSTYYKYIDTVESVDPSIGIRPGVSIPDGLDGTAEVVVGRSEESTLEIRALHRSVVDGILRYSGYEATLRMELWKGGRILVERHVFANCILSAKPVFPDGSEKSTNMTSGRLGKYFGFFAP